MFTNKEKEEFSKELNIKEKDILAILETLQKNEYSLKKKNVVQDGDSLFQQYLLGKGGQAHVFFGQDLKSGEEIAIKISKSNKSIFQDLSNELQTHEKIVFNYYIIKVYKHFLLEKSSICIQIVELCEKSLHDEICEMKNSNMQYSIDQIMNIFIFAINSLCEVNLNGIIHFDIKPANILIKKGQYKLGDFGLSKMVEQYQSDIVSCCQGTKYYRSPEQQNNRQVQMKFQTDVYSMGITLLKILGVSINKDLLDALNTNNYSYIEDQIKIENKQFYYFVKYFMIQKEDYQRYNAFRLKLRFIDWFDNIFPFEQEYNKIKNIIDTYETNQNIDKKRLSYLYLTLSQYIQRNSDSTLIQKSLKIIQGLNLQGQFNESFFQEHYAYTLFNSQKYQKAKDIFNKSYKIKITCLQNNILENACVLQNLSQCSYLHGRYEEMLNESKQSLQILQSMFDQPHPDIANSLNYVGIAYQYFGDVNKGLKYQLKALRMRQALYTGNHKDIAESLNSIGVAYNFLGQLEKGLEYKQKSLEMRQELFSGNHQDTAESFNSVGVLYHSLGDFEKGLEYKQKSLEMYEVLFQGYHKDIALSLNNVGTAYESLGNIKIGLKYKLQSLEMRQALFSGNHKDIAESLNSIGIAYKSLGDSKKGLDFFLRSLEMRQLFFQGNNKDIADSLNNVGLAYKSLGNFKKGLEYCLKSLEMRQALFQGNHIDTAVSLNNVGVTYKFIGDAQKGLEYKLKSLEMYKEVYCGDHKDIADSLNGIGVAYKSLGDVQKGLEYYLKSLEMRQVLFPGNHKDIAQSLNNVGIAYESLGDAKKGLEYKLKSLEMRQSMFSGNHKDIADSLNCIGVAYKTLGDVQKGLEYYLKSLYMRQILFLGNHKDIAESLNNVGIAYKSLGDAQKGQKYKQKSLEMRQAIASGNNKDNLKQSSKFSN